MVKVEIIHTQKSDPIRVEQISSVKDHDRDVFRIVSAKAMVYKDLKDKTAKEIRDSEPAHMRSIIRPHFPRGRAAELPAQKFAVYGDDWNGNWNDIEFASKTEDEDDELDAEQLPEIPKPDEAATFSVIKNRSLIGLVSFRPNDDVEDPEQRVAMAQAIMRSVIKHNAELQPGGGSAQSELLVVIPKKVTMDEMKAADRSMMGEISREESPSPPPTGSSNGNLIRVIIIISCVVLLLGIFAYSVYRSRYDKMIGELPQRFDSTGR